jgi:6-pyruvoyltetrahydropterin/6-carboxytetrahydropterin synthase
MTRLTASKRLEFAASHLYKVPNWSTDRNREFFGDDARGDFGHGHNFIVYVSFEGPMDPENGMVVELSIVKKQINDRILSHYDHYFLNTLPAFQDRLPTPEQIARNILNDAQTVFQGNTYTPVAVHLIENHTSAASAYATGTIERAYRIELISPHFYKAEIYTAPTLSVIVSGTPDPVFGTIVHDQKMAKTLTRVREWVSTASPDQLALHRNDEMPLALPILAQLPTDIHADRVHLKWGNTAIEANQKGQVVAEVEGQYTATHRLRVASMSESENINCFGKCVRPHGHTFDVAASFDLTHHRRPFKDLHAELDAVISPWQYTALDLLDEFKGLPASTELMIQKLWDRFPNSSEVVRIRLLETPNNRFSLRR